MAENCHCQSAGSRGRLSSVRSDSWSPDSVNSWSADWLDSSVVNSNSGSSVNFSRLEQLTRLLLTNTDSVKPSTGLPLSGLQRSAPRSRSTCSGSNMRVNNNKSCAVEWRVCRPMIPVHISAPAPDGLENMRIIGSATPLSARHTATRSQSRPVSSRVDRNSPRVDERISPQVGPTTAATRASSKIHGDIRKHITGQAHSQQQNPNTRYKQSTKILPSQTLGHPFSMIRPAGNLTSIPIIITTPTDLPVLDDAISADLDVSGQHGQEFGHWDPETQHIEPNNEHNVSLINCYNIDAEQLEVCFISGRSVSCGNL